MNTNQLLSVLDNIKKRKSFYVDVISSNELYKIRSKRAVAVIVNTDPSWKPGQHWVALFKPENGSLEVFDSYGRLLSEYNKYFTDLYEMKPVENCSTLQSVNSSTCGLFCLYFLYHRINGVSFTTIVDKFFCNKRLNDRLVIRFYKEKLECIVSNKKECVQKCCSFMRNKYTV